MADGSIILHLGLGSFHRAHQAIYLQRLIELGETEWSIAAANIRPDMLPVQDLLARQHGRYTVETVTPEGERAYQEVTAIRQVVPWDETLAGVVVLGARRETRIISFTVTEAGYYLTPKNELDTGFPDLASDLGQGTRRTIYGALTAILRERMRAGAGPVTLLSCDNLRANGERFHAGFTQFLRARGEAALLEWAEAHSTAPCSMVDRITPRPSSDVAVRVQNACGWDDRCPVMAESFIQWVIEDRFAAGRPPWERAGAEMVRSVAPYEEAKIRVLNGSHSAIAWAGALRGYQYIHQGVNDPAVRRIAFDYVTDDVLPCLAPSPLDLGAYRDTVLGRFSSPHIRDTIQRVAADGYSKLPGYVVPTIQDRLSRGEPIESVAMLPALFLRFLQRWGRDELPFAYQDQAMDEAATRAMLKDPAPLSAFCRDRVLWGALAGEAALEAAVARAFRRVQAWENAHGS